MSKLASWGLLAAGIEACGFKPADVRYLPTARFKLGLSGKGKCPYSPEAQREMAAILAAGQACSDDPADQDATLPLVADIDAPDAILLTQAARSLGALWVTGDKRCISAVASSPAYASIASALAGRALCLEQVLLRVADQQGFDELKRRVVGSNQLMLDTAVRAAFGSGLEADERNALGALERRVRILAAASGGLLMEQVYQWDNDE